MKASIEDIRAYVKLITSYCNDEISRDEFWAGYNKFFSEELKKEQWPDLWPNSWGIDR